MQYDYSTISSSGLVSPLTLGYIYGTQVMVTGKLFISATYNRSYRQSLAKHMVLMKKCMVSWYFTTFWQWWQRHECFTRRSNCEMPMGGPTRFRLFLCHLPKSGKRKLIYVLVLLNPPTCKQIWDKRSIVLTYNRCGSSNSNFIDSFPGVVHQPGKDVWRFPRNTSNPGYVVLWDTAFPRAPMERILGPTETWELPFWPRLQELLHNLGMPLFWAGRMWSKVTFCAPLCNATPSASM